MRVINIENEPEVKHWALFEYPLHFPLEETLLVSQIPDKFGLDFDNLDSPDLFFKKDINEEISRGYTLGGIKYHFGSPVFYGPEVIDFTICIKDEFTLDDMFGIEKVAAGIVYGLRRLGIDSLIDGNDVVILVDGEYKKCAGVTFSKWENGYTSYECMVTYNLDCDYINSIVDFSKPFWVEKEITDFNGIIGKIKDVTDKSIYEVRDSIIVGLSKIYEKETYLSSLNEEEETFFNTLTTNMLDSKWALDCIHPIFGKITGDEKYGNSN